RWGGADVLEFIPVILIMAGLLGVGLSASWYVIIRSYRQLNTGKFAALDELESKLAFPFFRREWELLAQGKSFRKYWKLATAETTLPVLFGFAYLAIALYGLVLFFC
ncbi:MAG: RipA family octameric membrane protein, partial [Gammaproteobacteria bacterium]